MTQYLEEIADYKPELFDVVRYFSNRTSFDERGYRRCPLIGEEKAGLVTFISFILMRIPVLLKAYSGTGKTILIDAVMSLIPKDKKYSIQMNSPKGIWYQAKEINKSDFIEFPEVQKAVQNEDVLETLKNWGEGKSAKRERTDMIGTFIRGEDSTIEQKLEWKPFITSLALHNPTTDIGKDEEFLRRVMEVRTDPSKAMTERVLKHKLQMWAKKTKYLPLDEGEMFLLKEHIKHCINLPSDIDFYNPVAEELITLIPKEFPIARSLIDNFIIIVNGVNKFYHKDRIFLPKEKMYIITPQDIYSATEIYLEQFIEGCLRIPILGREIINMFPKYRNDVQLEDVSLSEADILEKLKGEGFLLERFKVRSILGHLIQNCYLIETETSPKRYYKNPLMSFIKDKINWVDLINKCSLNLQNNTLISKDIFEDYKARFISEPVVKHPVSGKIINLSRKEDIDVSCAESKEPILTKKKLQKILEGVD